MVYEDNPESEKKTSKYNNAIDQIYRLGIIWRNAYKNSSTGNYSGWNLDLDAAWRELGGDLNEADKEHFEKIKAFKEINVRLVKLYPLVSQNPASFNKLPETYFDKVSKQYQVLDDKEIFLRRLQNYLGKGTAWNEEDEDDFG